MASTSAEQEQKQIPAEDVKEAEVNIEGGKKDSGQGSGADDSQQRSVEKICEDMVRLGVKPVKGVPRVIIETAGNDLLPISKPYVFKSLHSDTYVILGATKEEEEEYAEIGLDHRDIDLVMDQTGVCRSMAVKALKAHAGDIVSAIMELTH
ncbi:hypothetical protein KSS87_017001 [Heliosperma pusillum]|nr:hypothetical protein KSS87_017001 [Heliosperma pusillum]